MALFVLQPGIQPLGQFDFLDGDLASVKGGMLGVFGAVARGTAADLAAFDAKDGYVSSSVSEASNAATRPVLKIADGSTADDSKALYLLDEGTASYGTLFGSIISMFDPSGSALGPATNKASGKVTAWDKPGLYAATFEACYTATVLENLGNGTLAATGDTPAPGDLLYRHSTTGKICRADVATNPTLNKVGVYIEHATNGSLVTTPAKLVGASEVFDRIVFNYFGCNKNL
jgi:hypothetical protein